MNLDDRIRQSIERNTAQPGHLDTIPEGLLRRARRRVALTVGGAVLSLAVLVGGSLLLISSFGGPPKEEPASTPTTPAPATSEERAVRDRVDGFMRLRLDPESGGDGAGAYGYLNAALTRKFDTHEGGLFIFAPSRDVRWTQFTVDLQPTDSGRYRARIRVMEAADPSSETAVATRTFEEIVEVEVEPGQEGDEWSVTFLDISRVPREPGPTDAEPFWVLHDFFVARVAGSGAEPYLSPGGASSYGGRDLPLYATSDSPSYFFAPLISTMVRSGAGYEAVVRMTWGYAGDSTPCPRTEYLVLMPSGGSPAFHVTDAALVVPGWREGRLDVAAADELVCAFVHARLGYEGDPESFMSAGASQQYASGEGGLQLEPDTQGCCWNFWSLLDAREVEGGVLVTIVLDERNPGAIYEELFVQAVGGGSAEKQVASARRISCQEAGGYICH